MSYGRYGGGPPDNRRPGPSQQPVNPWQGGGFPAGGPAGGGNQGNLSMNLLGTLMNNSSGSGSMANLATSLVAQALQNKPGGMLIGGNHFGGGGPMSGAGPMHDSGPPPSRGFMDRSAGPRDDYRRSGRDHRSNSSSRRPNFRNNHRSRSRSPVRDHRRGGSRRDQDSRSSSNRGQPRSKPMRAGSPKDRAPFEIYIGNYPVRFREGDVRNLFQEHGVQVSTIRLKHDGHKVFAFAETSCEEEIQKAIKAMDSKEIHGRRLRVRSSKDKDRKDKQGSDEKKKTPMKRELTENDVTKHLVYAFTGFLTRQATKEETNETQKEQLEQVQNLLKEAFALPDDDSLKISRNLELIFLQNNRREIPLPEIKVEEQPEAEPLAAEDIKVEVKAEDESMIVQEENGSSEEQSNKNEQDSEQVSAQVELETKDEEQEEEEKDEEAELMDQLGDAVENLIEEQDKETEEEPEVKEEEPEVQEEEEATTPSPANRGGGRGRGGRGAGRARRSRGRRGA